MRSTLFHIPATLYGTPVFGLGWLLAAWVIVGVVATVLLLRRPGGSKEIAGLLPFFLIVAGVIALLLPNLVESDAAGKPLGLPVRGYGVMLMLATIASVALAAYRAAQVGIEPETIYSLAFTMFVAGIIGARLFFILEYWNQFVLFNAQGKFDLAATAQAIFNVTKGGLVVYGSVLFGVPAGIWFCRSRNLPMLAIGDIIAPSMVLGLAIGRLGCFLNGCCFGGVCLSGLAANYAVTFPSGSPPYFQQEEAGWQSGIWLDEKDGKILVAYVAPQGPAVSSGIQAGDQITSVNGAKVASLVEARKRLVGQSIAASNALFEIETADGRILRWQAGHGPPRSVPVHAAQLYAAIDAGLLVSLLWFFFPYRRRDGEVFALLLTLHPISRFLMEMIRTDEPGQFGTGLTIAQWISLGILAAGLALWIVIERQPRGTVLTPTIA